MSVTIVPLCASAGFNRRLLSIMSETELNTDQMREMFKEKVNSIQIRINSSLIPNAEAYEKLISETENAKSRAKKTYTDYRRLKRYDVLTIGESKKLIRPLSENEKDIKYYVHIEQLFDIIHAEHLTTGHGGKHKLENQIKTKYLNITREVIQIYLELCLECKNKKAQPKKVAAAKSLMFKEFNERAQVDLIDMEARRDGDYKFVLIYQEDLTKFVFLRPLKTKTVAEVAYNLIDILCVIGAPSVLQSYNGREFCNRIILELKNTWPSLKIVHDKPSDSQTQGVIRDVQDMLIAWNEENNVGKWSEGLRFCQWKKNNSFHSAIKQTPYEAMFGKKCHIDLGSSNLPSSAIDNPKKEKELEDVDYSTDVDDTFYEKLDKLAKTHHTQQGKTQEALHKINVTLQLLLEAANLNLGEMLISSAKTGDSDRVRLLLDAGANVEYQDSNGNRSLHAASENNHPDILAILIDYRAQVNSRGRDELTALHLAAEKGYINCARILLDTGASVDVRDKSSVTPLMKSVVNSHAEMAALLVAKGAEVDAIGPFHFTALHAAAWHGCLECVEILVRAGADQNLQNGSGFTPLELAEDRGHKEIIGFLKRKAKQ